MTRFQLLVHRVSVWAHQHAILERLEDRMPTFCAGVLLGLLACFLRSL